MDLVEDPANECEPDPEEDMISFADLQEAFPAGFYEFEGRSADGEIYDDEAELTFDIPAGPVL